MNTKILIIILIGAAGISTFGALSNDVELIVQKYEVFESVDTFTEGFTCACENPSVPGDFHMMWCDVTYLDPPDNTIPDPNSLGAVGNHLCTWETHEGEYGGGLPPKYEGCSTNFWQEYGDPKSPDYVWPSGFHPYDEYENIFNVDPEVFFDIKKGHENHDDSVDSSHDDSSHDDSTEKEKGDKKYFTLMDALLEKGKYHKVAILSESVAAVLNAAHHDVDYHYSIRDSIDLLQYASFSGDMYDKVLKEFQNNNNEGRSLLCYDE